MTSPALFVGIDIGTTSVKTVVIDQTGNKTASYSQPYKSESPKASWVQQQPQDWWEAAKSTLQLCLTKTDKKHIKAISFSGHMSALVMLGKDGEVLAPAITVADNRSYEQTKYLKEHFLDEFVSLTGNEPLDAFTVSKLLWVKDNWPAAYEKLDKFCFPKDYVRYKMTGKIGTDYTDAGNSLLFNRYQLCWEDQLIEKAGLDKKHFPDLYRTSQVFEYLDKEAAEELGLEEGTPVITGGADIACSQIGTGTIADNKMAITLSTSAQVVMNVPIDQPLKETGKVTYHPGVSDSGQYVMGTIFSGGLSVEWAYKLLFNKKEMDQEAYEQLHELTNQMDGIPPGSNGLLFLPFLVGSSTPYYEPKDRGTWLGLTVGRTKAEMLHSVFEGVSLNILDNIHSFHKIGLSFNDIYLGAGGSKNRVWAQIIANVTNKPVHILKGKDNSAIGACINAAVGAGYFKHYQEAIQNLLKIEITCFPDQQSHLYYLELHKDYQEVYQAATRFYQKYTT